MRILMIPRIDTIDGTCSLSRLPLGFVRETLKQNEGSYFYLVVHEDFCKDKEWLRNYGIENLDRIELIPLSLKDVGKWDMVAYQRRLEYTVGPALAAKVRPFDVPGRYADVVITECFQSVHFLRSILTGFYFRGYIPNIPIICWSHWNPTSEWVRLGKSGVLSRNDWQASVTGLVGADGVIFGSIHQRDQTFDDLVRWMNAKEVSRFKDEWVVIESGVEFDKIPYLEREEEGLVGLWSGYTSQDFYPCAPALVRSGMTKRISKAILQFMGVKIGTKKPEEVENYKNLDYVDIRPVLSHEDFVDMLAESDFMVTTVPGVWSIRVAEAMAAGCIPFTTKFTADSMYLPKDYPFIITDAKCESNTMAFSKYLQTNEERDKWRKFVYDHSKEHFEIKKQSQKVYDYAESFLLKNMENFKGGDMFENIKKAVNGKDKVNHFDVVNDVGAKYFRTGCESMFSHRFLRHCLFILGYKDTGEEVPVYVK